MPRRKAVQVHPAECVNLGRGEHQFPTFCGGPYALAREGVRDSRVLRRVVGRPWAGHRYWASSPWEGGSGYHLAKSRKFLGAHTRGRVRAPSPRLSRSENGLVIRRPTLENGGWFSRRFKGAARDGGQARKEGTTPSEGPIRGLFLRPQVRANRGQLPSRKISRA